MPWNYRVLRHDWPPIGSVKREPTYEVHEVYFADGREDQPHSCTKNGVTVSGESVSELRGVLERMIRALEKPVLDYKDF